MKASIFLADYAATDELGKVNAIGLGWSQNVTPLPAFAIVVVLEAGSVEEYIDNPFTIDLCDSDGVPYAPQGDSDTPMLSIDGTVSVDNFDPAAEVQSLRQFLVINVTAGMPAPAGSYSFRVSMREGVLAHVDFDVADS